jgi:hypothetical protein
MLQGRSPVQPVLPAVHKIQSSRLILIGNRPEGRIRKVKEEEEEKKEKLTDVITKVP